VDETSILLAKFAGLQKNFANIQWGRTSDRASERQVLPLVNQYFKCREELIKLLPDLFNDLPEVEFPTSIGQNNNSEPLYNHSHVLPISQSIDYILEVRSNYRIGERVLESPQQFRVFLSHGRSNEWFKVQSYLERDLDLKTLELAQEANQGRTVLQKLNEESRKCKFAVIVMTGDDIAGDQVRARENVMHEIGFFQGRYGLENIVLLHEEGVNIPSNIHGLVYIPFPKNTVEASFGALLREIKVVNI
jgi:hypothetical protein